MSRPPARPGMKPTRGKQDDGPPPLPESASTVTSEEDRMAIYNTFTTHKAEKGLPTDSIGLVLRRCGLNPTQPDIDKVTAEYVEVKRSTVSLTFAAVLIPTDQATFRLTTCSGCMLYYSSFRIC